MTNTFTITAHLLCHDVRVSTYVSTVIEAENKPSEAEAIELIRPAAEEVLRRAWGEDCQYELSGMTVQQTN